MVIYLTGRPFHRVVVDVDEPERVHRRIDAGLLHSKKISARCSVRHNRPSTTDQPALDTEHSRAEERPNGTGSAAQPGRTPRRSTSDDYDPRATRLSQPDHIDSSGPWLSFNEARPHPGERPASRRPGLTVE